MPRPLWTGAISFGLVTIPVKVVSATEDHDVHFHRVHLKDMGRVAPLAVQDDRSGAPSR